MASVPTEGGEGRLVHRSLLTSVALAQEVGVGGRTPHSAFVTPHPLKHIIGQFLISHISPTARKPLKSKCYKPTLLAQKMLIIVTGSVSDIVR